MGAPRARPPLGAASSVADITTAEMGRHVSRSRRSKAREVDVEMPLVEFVQHDGVNPGQIRLGQQAAHRDAFRRVNHPGRRGGALFEPYRISDRGPNRFTTLFRDADRGQRTSADGAAPAPGPADSGQAQSGRRHPRRLAAPGRRLQHHRAMLSQQRRGGAAGADRSVAAARSAM